MTHTADHDPIRDHASCAVCYSIVSSSVAQAREQVLAAGLPFEDVEPEELIRHIRIQAAGITAVIR